MGGQLKRGDAARLVALDAVGGQYRRDVAGIGDRPLAGAAPGHDAAPDRGGLAKLGAGVVDRAERLPEMVVPVGRELVSLHVPVVDPPPVHQPVRIVHHERLADRDGPETRRQVARRVEQNGRSQAVLVTERPRIRPRAVRAGHHHVEVDVPRFRLGGEVVHRGQVIRRHRAPVVHEHQSGRTRPVLVAQGADIPVYVQEAGADDLGGIPLWWLRLHVDPGGAGQLDAGPGGHGSHRAPQHQARRALAPSCTSRLRHPAHP